MTPYSPSPLPIDPANAAVEEGTTLAKAGQLDQAIRHFRTALLLRPNFAKAHHNLAIALAQKGKPEEAVEQMLVALQIEPQYAEAWSNLGNIYGQMNRSTDSMASYRRALALRPDHVETLNNLGLALFHEQQQEEAVILLQQAIRLRPEFAEAHNNLALAQTDLGEFAAAIQSLEQALRINPRYSEAHSNLGNCYRACGQLAKALACYDYALTLQPNAISTHWNRSLTLLQMGRFDEGWQEYEWRRRKANNGIRPFAQPMWDGSSFVGRTLLLHMEQGFGDQLQFIRFAAAVKSYGGSVLVACPERLVRLFGRCPGVDHVVKEQMDLPPFDIHAPLLSLPAILKTTLATVPARIPYLSPDPALVEKWRRRLANGEVLTIGIAWQGNPKHIWDRHRSVPLASFAPLARIDGVRLVSLQKGPGSEQVSQIGQCIEVMDLGQDFHETTDFMETAAVVQALDLVITVDSATGHLAGALGRPTWIALATITDWRWLHDRDDSPWYPTVRLFRQQQLGQWKPVFAAMVAALQNRRRLEVKS